jgi:hypothetical protein
MKKEKEKTYTPPTIKIFDIKELLKNFDNELLFADTATAGGVISVIIPTGPAFL